MGLSSQMETVEVPPKAEGPTEPFAYLTVKVRADLGITLVDEGTEIQLSGADLPASLREHLRSQVHIVFVQFEDGVPWRDVVGTVDRVHGVAGDTHVALKVGCDSDCDQR